jgi:hypothetical protein
VERVTLSPVRRTPGAPALPIVAGAALAVPVLAAAYALLRGDGGLSDDGAIAARLGAAVAVLVAGLLVATGVLRAPRLGRAGAIAAIALAAYAVLAAVSTTWSVSPLASRDDAFTATAYLAAYLAGATLIPILGRPFTTVAIGVGGLATAVSGWAIVARSFDATTSAQFSARLTGTAGLPNLLAVVAVFGLLCGLALAAEQDRRHRLAGGALASLHTSVILLSGSRAGLLLGLTAAIVLLVLLDQRPLVRFGPLASAVPGAAAGVFASTWDAFEARPPLVPDAGPQLIGLIVAATVLGALVAVRLGERLDRETRRRRGIRLSPRTALLVLALLAAAGIGAVAAAGGPGDAIESVRERVIEDAGAQEGVRQTSVSANQRDHWWRTAWDAFLDEPLEGYGAGTFRLVEAHTREPAQPASSPHNVVLEALAGLGLAGGLLIVTAAVAMLAAAASGVMRAQRGEEAAAAVLALGAGVMLVHALVDVDWDFLGFGVPLLAVLGALASRGVIEDRSPALRAVGGGAALAAAALAFLLVPPWLASRDVDASSSAENPRRALELAQSARDHDADSVPALLAEADARERLGDRPGTEKALEQAIGMEPWNYEPYLRLGLYRNGWGDPVGAGEPLLQAFDLSGGQPSLVPIINDVRAQLGLAPWG